MLDLGIHVPRGKINRHVTSYSSEISKRDDGSLPSLGNTKRYNFVSSVNIVLANARHNFFAIWFIFSKIRLFAFRDRVVLCVRLRTLVRFVVSVGEWRRWIILLEFMECFLITLERTYFVANNSIFYFVLVNGLVVGRTLLTLKYSCVRETATLCCICVVSKYFLLA